LLYKKGGLILKILNVSSYLIPAKSEAPIPQSKFTLSNLTENIDSFIEEVRCLLNHEEWFKKDESLSKNVTNTINFLFDSNSKTYGQNYLKKLCSDIFFCSTLDGTHAIENVNFLLNGIENIGINNAQIILAIGYLLTKELNHNDLKLHFKKSLIELSEKSLPSLNPASIFLSAKALKLDFKTISDTYLTELNLKQSNSAASNNNQKPSENNYLITALKMAILGVGLLTLGALINELGPPTYTSKKKNGDNPPLPFQIPLNIFPKNSVKHTDASTFALYSSLDQRLNLDPKAASLPLISSQSLEKRIEISNKSNPLTSTQLINIAYVPVTIRTPTAIQPEVKACLINPIFDPTKNLPPHFSCTKKHLKRLDNTISQTLKKRVTKLKGGSINNKIINIHNNKIINTTKNTEVALYNNYIQNIYKKNSANINKNSIPFIIFKLFTTQLSPPKYTVTLLELTIATIITLVGMRFLLNIENEQSWQDSDIEKYNTEFKNRIKNMGYLINCTEKIRNRTLKKLPKPHKIALRFSQKLQTATEPIKNLLNRIANDPRRPHEFTKIRSESSQS